jgi:hypothetical protein
MDIFNILDFINTPTDTNKGKGWNYSKRKCEPQNGSRIAPQ